MEARLLSLGFSLLLQPQNMRAQRIEALFSDIAEQRILVTGCSRSDLCPIFRLKSLKRGRKEISAFHHHVVPLMPDEIVNDGNDSFSKHFTTRKHVVDGVSNTAQALSPFAVLVGEITDLRSRSRIAHSQLGKHQVFLGMMMHFRVDLEIAENRANNLVVRVVSPAEYFEFPLEHGKQPFNIAMLLGQALNDHGGAPHSEPRQTIPDAA